MNAKILPNTLAFDGVLDEGTSVDSLLQLFEKLKENGMKPPVTVDLSQVRYSNSVGVLSWLKFTKQTAVSLKYVNSPIWLVNQFNAVNNYFDHDSFVETFQAPFFLPKTQDSRTFTLQIGKDIPVMEDYSEFTIPNRIADGNSYEIDFDPQRYFYFICENYHLFKNKIGTSP